MGSELALISIAVAITGAVCMRAVVIGKRLGVLDHPDNVRKRHSRVTPQVGGAAVIAGLLFWLIAGGNHAAPDTTLVMVIELCGVGVALVGFTDDQKGVSPLARLAFLSVFVLLAMVLDHNLVVPRINSETFGAVRVSIGFYYVLIAVAALGVVNAVNMADGQDGVAGGMFVIWTACLAMLTTGTAQAIAGMLHVLCLLFLLFNLKPKGKVFLGDCGSYGITFIIGLLVIMAHARGQVPIETIIVWFFIPILDCLRLLVSRARQGLSPFEPDRDHFHHRLEDRFGKTWGLACYLSLVGVTSILSTLAPHWAPVCLCVLSGSYVGLSMKRLTALPEPSISHIVDLRANNVVSMITDSSRGQPRAVQAKGGKL